MIKRQLCNARQLQSLNNAGLCIIVDCRFDLTDPEKGRSDWLKAHIPGARYAHLDEDLSSPVTPTSGRHPLPDANKFAEFLDSLGWTPNKLLIAYDDASNAVASRLWWLMRYFNQRASLLDGGLAAWKKAGLPLQTGLPVWLSSGTVKLTPQPDRVISAEDVIWESKIGRLHLIDARAQERFSGELEPLDSKGGHIPGAWNRPFQANLNEDSCFKEPDVLREEFEALLDGRKLSQVAHYCGSGVTACHNAFAMELAGLDPTLLYPGSWSEWIRDPAREVETGPGQ